MFLSATASARVNPRLQRYYNLSEEQTEYQIKGYVNRMAELQEHSSALDRLDQVIDWEKFRPTLEKTLEGSAQGPGGRPRYEVVMKRL